MVLWVGYVNVKQTKIFVVDEQTNFLISTLVDKNGG
jgi:hypothetical protein